MNRRMKLFLLVVLTVALAGCTEMHTSVTIGEDGEVESYEIEIVYDDETWDFLNSLPDWDDDYETLEDMIHDNPEEEFGEDDIDSADCTDAGQEVEIDHAAQRIVVTCTEPITDDSEFDVDETGDGTLSISDESAADWEDELEGSNEFDMDIDELDYTFTITFPGEVGDTNAHEVDGNTLTWDMNELDEDGIQANVDSPGGLPADGTDNGDDEGTDETGEADEGDEDEQAGDDEADDDETDDETDDEADADDEGDDDETDDEADADDEGDDDADDDGASGFTVVGVAIALASLLGIARYRR